MGPRASARAKKAAEPTALAASGSEPADDSQSAKLLAYVNDSRHFSMIRALHLADMITEMNCACGVLSIFASLRYGMGPVDELRPLWQAMAFMPAGLLFDFMDGKVARWRRKSSLMGQELDSLADLVSFGVAPATCVYAWGLRTLVDTLVLVFFVLCGLSRLARFNVSVNSVPKDASGKAKYFEGTPIPTTLGLVLVVAVSTYCGFGGGNALPGGVWASGTLVEVHPFVFLFMLSGFCMTSKSLKIPKP